MDEQGICPRLGKNMKEKKSKIENELSSLKKKILDLQHQRKLAYKNSVKVKKTIQNQINQIVKSLRARERYLLSKVDEAYMSQDTYYDKQLSFLRSREIRCCVLNCNLEHFKDKMDAVKRINNMLEEVKYLDAQTSKPLQFISSYESVKEAANSYGCLEGDFVDMMDFPSEDCYLDNQICPMSVMDKDLHIVSDNDEIRNKLKHRERTESQDSFEIIDLFDTMNCEDSDNNACESEAISSTTSADCSKNSCILPEAQPQYSGGEKRKENIMGKMYEVPFLRMPSKCCLPSVNEERICKVTQQTLENCSQKRNVNYDRYLVATDAKSWLQSTKNSSFLNPAIDRNSNSEKINPIINVTSSQVDLVKCAFESYLKKDNIEKWLSK